MQTAIDAQDIDSIVETAQIEGFTGKFTSLGGGEVNDTLLLDCGAKKAILRVAKYNDVNNLGQEAKALSLLDIEQVPKLIYFNEAQRIKGRAWIVESHVVGTQVDRLSIKQLESLGGLLANIHKVHAKDPVKLDFWENFLDASKHFGDERALLNHPDNKLNRLIHKSREYFDSQSFDSITPSLIHGDVTLSNMLVNNDLVSLIDWEFSKFKDPMADFSTMFYEDMDYNKGKWRIHIKDEEKNALFDSYTNAGGVIDEKRLKVWFSLDKLGAAVYLYWKQHQSDHDIQPEQSAQYQVDLDNLLESLERNL